MSGYIVRRLMWAVPTLLVVALFTFGLLYMTPGDPAALMAGDLATPEDVEKMREYPGLNKPFPIRFGSWLGGVIRGDLGASIRTGRPVLSLIVNRLEPTLALAIMIEAFILIVGVPLGVVAAWKQNTWIDRTTMVVAVVGFSVPGFWLAFMAMWLFGIKLGWLPVAGYVPISDGLLPFIQYLILPVAVTSVIAMALIVRMTRACVVDVLREDYIRTARSKGLRERVVLFRHALKNAAPPILTVLGLGFAGLVTGLIITETVFAIPGLGSLIVTAIAARDYPIIQAFVLLVAAVYVGINLLVDLLYAYFDPRIRY